MRSHRHRPACSYRRSGPRADRAPQSSAPEQQAAHRDHHRDPSTTSRSTNVRAVTPPSARVGGGSPVVTVNTTYAMLRTARPRTAEQKHAGPPAAPRGSRRTSSRYMITPRQSCYQHRGDREVRIDPEPVEVPAQIGPAMIPRRARLTTRARRRSPQSGTPSWLHPRAAPPRRIMSRTATRPVRRAFGLARSRRLATSGKMMAVPSGMFCCRRKVLRPPPCRRESRPRRGAGNRS